MRYFTTLLLTIVCFSSFSQIKRQQVVKSKNGKASEVVFNPNGKNMAVASSKNISLYLNQAANSYFSFKTKYSLLNELYFINSSHLLFSGYNKFGKHYKHYSIYNIEKREFVEVKNLKHIEEDITAITPYRNENLGVAVMVGKKLLLYSKNDSSTISFENIIVDAEYDENSESFWVVTAAKELIKYEVSTNSIKQTINLKEIPTSIALSKNGERIALADKKKNLYYTDKNLSYQPQKLNGKKGKKRYTNLSFSLDGKYLASTNLMRLDLWQIESKANLYSKKRGGKGILSSIKFDPSGQLLAVSGYTSRKIELWNTSGLNIAPFMEFKDESDKTPPQVVLTNPKVPKDKVSVTQEEITLEGLVIDNIGVSEVKVNGQKANLSATGDFSVKLNLAIGENRVAIEATDVNKNTSVKRITIIRKEFDLNSLSLESQNHMLLISIDKYINWSPLNNAVSDGNKLTKILEDKYGFDSSNVIEVKNENADRQGIINGFKELISKAGPNDNVIIYYSGHGYFDAQLGEGYWIPVDAQKGQDGDYLPNSFMMQLMKKVNSKHIFLVADACFSGSLFNNSNRGYTDNVGSYKSRWGLASGRLEYVSDGNSGESSPFNKYLTEYLEKNKKEEFSVSELVQFVKINVANATKQAPVGNPLGGLGDEGGEFIFKLKE
ncbi:MAG: WD40 repeat protein [Vicingaceae bacterium]|jgi:WD40 repeat protein